MEKLRKVAINQIAQYLETQNKLLSDQQPDWYSDIVTEVRHMVKMNPDYDSIPEDFGYNLLNGRVEHATGLLFNIDDHNQYVPCWAEQDITLININTLKEWGNAAGKKVLERTLATLLYDIFAEFDCPGCCDAIEYVRLSRFGMIIKINSGMTFHS